MDYICERRRSILANDNDAVRTVRMIIAGHTTVSPEDKDKLLAELLRDRDEKYLLVIEQHNAIESQLSGVKSAMMSLQNIYGKVRKMFFSKKPEKIEYPNLAKKQAS